jgi:hypothetical protein
MSAGIIAAGEAQTRLFAIVTIAHGLALEINTGMKVSRMGALQGARNHGLIAPNGRSKKAALKAAVKLLKEVNPDYQPSESIKKALG